MCFQKAAWAMAAKALTTERVAQVVSEAVTSGGLRADSSDVSLACGACGFVKFIVYTHPAALEAADSVGLFLEVVGLLDWQKSLTAQWWIDTAVDVDVTSMQLICAWSVAPDARRLTDLPARPWWRALIDHAIANVKLNAELRLSEQPTMCHWPICFALTILETASTHESEHAALLEPKLIDALEYATANDSLYMMLSLSAYGAGVLAELLGRSEKGKTLSREAVVAIAGSLHRYFGSERFAATPKSIIGNLHRIVITSISDANKRLMLQCDGLMTSLVNCLLLGDSERRAQAGADALQEAAACAFFCSFK